ncbi:hypothetical protein D1B31_10720 [Neobacillus notoginsengisoli]|uniref:LiaI-LiaF-like transmembrane region domain-containing protein n=1 Tax=Neobacillus notoginsengisoli TaxID=1578198 RepID=A0A417YU46_9BACI|nr:DUF5668 domain-containing protein [Neobacillus notoginsengisoli]RHW40662.1 hypothetical protein D1B31_10720 [Neobacillus notoginsengisoli]
MKNRQLFPGIVLIGFGAYFFMEKSEIELLEKFYTWPTLLLIVGIAFLCQGYLTREHDAILPGTILTGLGGHFHIAGNVQSWPPDTGTFMAIIALGFLLRYQKTGNGLFHGLLFLAVAILLIFTEQVDALFGQTGSSMTLVWKFWPAILLAIGAWLVFAKRR